MSNLEKSRPYKTKAVIGLVILFQILICFQGFDLCDEGMSLTFYQQFFNEPQSVEYNFVYWLSGLIGGIWYEIYPKGGILWFRFLAIIVNTATFLISLKLLRHFMKPFYAAIGLAMVMLANDYGFLVFYHNPLTGFLAVLTIYYLIIGLIEKKAILLVIAGFICTINISARLPNLLFLAISLCIPYYFWLKHKNLKSSLSAIGLFGTGVVAGFLVVIFLLNLLGQWEIMKSSLSGIFTSGTTQTSNHGIGFLLEQYILSFKLVIKHGLLIVLASTVLYLILNFFKLNNIWKYGIVIISIVALAFAYGFKNVEFLYLLSIIGCIGVLVFKFSAEKKLLALAAIMAAIILPMGSDGGIRNCGYMAIWISVPIFFLLLSQFNKTRIANIIQFNNFKQIYCRQSFGYVALILVLSFFVRKVYNISQEAYFDPGSRFNKTATINNNLARGILTKPKRAEIVNELLDNLNNYVSAGDYLLAYDKLPTIHFLTETKPYMYNPWVWVYDENSFKNNIERAERERANLPIVLQQKFETIRAFSEPMEDYMSETKENTYRYNKGRTTVMNNFLERNQYKVVWSNSYFNILRSDKEK